MAGRGDPSVTDLPRIDSPEVALQQPHVMTDGEGSVFYPDSEEDARWFATEHDARPVNPDVFPFKL